MDGINSVNFASTSTPSCYKPYFIFKSWLKFGVYIFNFSATMQLIKNTIQRIISYFFACGTEY